MGLRLRRMQRQSKAQDTADRLMRRMEGAGQHLKCLIPNPWAQAILLVAAVLLVMSCCCFCHKPLLPTHEAAHSAAA